MYLSCLLLAADLEAILPSAVTARGFSGQVQSSHIQSFLARSQPLHCGISSCSIQPPHSHATQDLDAVIGID